MLKERECISIRETNIQIQTALDRERLACKDVQVLQAAFEEEHSKRRGKDREVESFKTELLTLQELKQTESEHYKRALDEIRSQFELEIKKGQVKDEEVRSLHSENQAAREKIQLLEEEAA
jgi:hypothetical protein